MTDTTKEDIKFLLSFAPALDPERVVPGLSSMFYLTTSYEGDLALAQRTKEICERHGIDVEEIADADGE